jgi:hypothetical protein
MPILNNPGPGKDKQREPEREDILEEALEESFPSSDPVAIVQPTVATKKRAAPKRGKTKETRTDSSD